MAWVNGCPSFLVPLALSLEIVAVTPIPQTPLLAIVSSNTVILYDSRNLVPLAVHRRLFECMDSHGPNIQAKVRHISVDSAKLDQLPSVNLFVKTKSNFVLIYHIFVNYAKSLYEVSDKNDGEKLLQNCLPLALASSRFNLTALFKSATRTIIQGGSALLNLENIEHFQNCADDDGHRNENIPLPKLTLVKILKMNAGLTGYWCKLNSHNLIFYNDCHELQLLNIKSFKNEIIKLPDYPWFYDTVLVEYNLLHNYFLHLNSERELSLVDFVLDETNKLTLGHSMLLKLEFECKAIFFNPQFDLVVLQTDSSLKIYKLFTSAKKHAISFLKTILEFPKGCQLEVKWSPCGTFLMVVNEETGTWQLVSKFGQSLFESHSILGEMSSSRVETSDVGKISDFCTISKFAIASNAQHLYLVNKEKTRMYFLRLSRLQNSSSDVPIIYDDNYLSVALSQTDNSFCRFPLLPSFQKIISKLHHINGTSVRLSTKKATGILNIRSNSFDQLSISYGENLAISTPIRYGEEVNHATWYIFANYFMESMNIVDHFWIDDYLVVINRFVKDDIEEETDSDHDPMVDELIILDTAPSKYGNGGAAFRFDSDLIVWRHSFKGKIINFELVDSKSSTNSKTLVLVTGDLKIIMMEVNKTTPKAETADTPKQTNHKISIRVRRTIHLSSIKNKLPIPLVQQMSMVDFKHFFFLLNNGDLYLLKNQLPNSDSDVSAQRGAIQMNNMYDLIKISAAVESFQVLTIDFNEECKKRFITLFNGDEILIFNLTELVDRVYEFEGVEHSSEVDVFKVLQPVRIQISTFHPLKIRQSSGSIEVTGFEYRTIFKNDHLMVKHKTSKQLILNRFIQHDLFENNLELGAIIAKYSQFGNFDYCLELLLFDFLDDIDKKDRLDTVCKLVDATTKADSIYVNFLRKIEVKYWYKFFKLLGQTPVSFMNRLIESRDVELCYNYLIVYLNFKREFESTSTPLDSDDNQSILDERDRAIISQLIKLLQEAHRWEECFELCRFIKLLEPTGELLEQIRDDLKV